MKILQYLIKSCYQFIIGLILLCLLFLAYTYLLGKPPVPTTEQTILFDEANQIIDKAQQSKQFFSLEELSPDLVTAIVITEDRHFFEHYGFDIGRIFKAIITNITSKRLKEGASTITQQLARNLYLSHEKTWLRKFKEAFYTIRLEMFYSKDDILTAYLQNIYYGHGVYGAMHASDYFFQKDGKDLSLAEAALLAGIPKGPTYYSPYNDLQNASKRQKLILKLLLDHQAITEAAYEEALQTPIILQAKPDSQEKASAYYQDFVFKEAKQILQVDDTEKLAAGYEIYTTLKQDVQNEMTKQAKTLIGVNNPLEVGMIVQKTDGAIIGLIGGKDYVKSAYNRATNAKRLVGSTFKPLLYYAALEKGFTPATTLMSEPTSFKLMNGTEYTPQNFNHYYAHAPITLAQALALSDNIYAVKTQLFLQSSYVVETAKKFGIKGDLPEVPSLALGSASLSLLEMTNAYRLIANNGLEQQAYTIRKIIDAHGRTVFERELDKGKQILDDKKAYILTQLMTGMFDRKLDGYMSVTGATIADKLTTTYAGKSGTTKTDNWMIGFSPQIVVGVWTGFDQNEPITAQKDRSSAKELWANIIEYTQSFETNADFSKPPGVTAVEIDPITGSLATSLCPITKESYFESDMLPTTYCRSHPPDQKETPPDKEISEGYLKRLFKMFFKKDNKN